MDYARFKGLERDVMQVFVDVITAMDAVFLEWSEEERERKQQEKHDGQ